MTLNVTNLGNTYGQVEYHALHARLERRFAQGFSVAGAYTLSKSMDNVGQGFPGESFSGGAVQNFYDSTAMGDIKLQHAAHADHQFRFRTSIRPRQAFLH